MKVQFALCAHTASVDRATNRLSIFNVIDQFPASVLPIYIPSIAFVSVIESDRDESPNVKGVLEITASARLLGRFEVPISFTNGRLARVILNFQGMPVHQAGPVVFRLTIPDEVVAETTFQVVSLGNTEAIQVAPNTPPTATPSSGNS